MKDTLLPMCTPYMPRVGRHACIGTGGFISAKYPNVKPAGQYQVIVRLPSATPTTLSAYPANATQSGQLLGSPVPFTFDAVSCEGYADQVPSTDGSDCVCGPGYTRVDDPSADADAMSCEPCPIGFYKDNIEASNCRVRCPGPPYAPEALTLQTASARPGACQNRPVSTERNSGNVVSVPNEVI